MVSLLNGSIIEVVFPSASSFTRNPRCRLERTAFRCGIILFVTIRVVQCFQDVKNPKWGNYKHTKNWVLTIYLSTLPDVEKFAEFNGTIFFSNPMTMERYRQKTDFDGYAAGVSNWRSSSIKQTLYSSRVWQAEYFVLCCKSWLSALMFCGVTSADFLSASVAVY